MSYRLLMMKYESRNEICAFRQRRLGKKVLFLFVCMAKIILFLYFCN
jgi:hypothetical protein